MLMERRNKKVLMRNSQNFGFSSSHEIINNLGLNLVVVKSVHFGLNIEDIPEDEFEETESSTFQEFELFSFMSRT
jgi:hypothetical protein